jgi:hypothetical protein
VLVAFSVKKGDLEPDTGADWKSHLRQYRKDVVKWHGKEAVQNPSAAVTYATINPTANRLEVLGPSGSSTSLNLFISPRTITSGASCAPGAS